MFVDNYDYSHKNDCGIKAVVNPEKDIYYCKNKPPSESSILVSY